MEDLATSSSHAAGRVACFFGGRRGMGHLTRQATILRALRQRAPETEFLVQMKAPDHHVLGEGEFRTLVGDAASGVSVADTLRSFRPDLLLFDTLFPKEPPPVERLGHPRPAAVLTLRRVRPERLDAIFENPWMDWVRLLLIPHAEEEFSVPAPRREGLRTVFTGPIVASRPPADLDALRNRYGIQPDDQLVVASLGGGGVPDFAQDFTSTVLAAFEMLRGKLRQARLVLVVGPKNEGTLELDVAQGDPAVRVVTFEPHLPDLYGLASIAIAHGGYNTTNEILGAGTPILFLPCPAKYDDGVQRARSFAARGVAYVVEDMDPRAVAELLAHFFEDAAEERGMLRALEEIDTRPGNDLAARALIELIAERQKEETMANTPLKHARTDDRSTLSAPPFRLPVLSYHLVDPSVSDRWSVPPETLEAQLDWLATNARVIGLPEALELLDAGQPAPDDAVVLTFDDGYESFLENVSPLLRARNMTATLFLITSWMGELNEWNPRARYLARHLSWDQARELLAQGFELGAHGRAHQALVKFDRKRIKEELHGSANDIRDAVGVDPQFVAYPFGTHDKTVIKVARKRFRLGFASGTKGVRDWRDDPFRIHRIVVGSHLSLGEFATRIHRYTTD